MMIKQIPQPLPINVEGYASIHPSVSPKIKGFILQVIVRVVMVVWIYTMPIYWIMKLSV